MTDSTRDALSMTIEIVNAEALFVISASSPERLAEMATLAEMIVTV
jgi:hypothetical protein